jgi:hypothetical protein
MGGSEQPKKKEKKWIQLTNKWGTSPTIWINIGMKLPDLESFKQTRIDKYLITIFSFVILFKFGFSPLSLQELSRN